MRAHPDFIRTTDDIGALCVAVRVNLLTSISFAVMMGVGAEMVEDLMPYRIVKIS